MKKLKGLFIEDEVANIKIYTELFALEGLELECLDKLPENLERFYDIVLEKNVDFLIIDYHLDKQVTYKGIDVLREIRKSDSTIYAVLLTNYQLEDFADQFGDYDYELKKDTIVERYKDVAEKIKRACELRKENLIYKSIDGQQSEESDTIKLLREISSKLDTKE
ncbi:response regulator [Clostridium sp. P21]|uniref:Response regulator n=1 Tax=Clostridium muellerianum TaxID=2716538 RepID=A0A7Y0HS27_9CLOT|nr:response regulator [Clostridium muellerianum]